MAGDAHGLRVRVMITEGTRADCQQACRLMDGISAENLLADRAYDRDEVLAYLAGNETKAVIPPKRNRRQQRQYDEYLYTLRPLVENAF